MSFTEDFFIKDIKGRIALYMAAVFLYDLTGLEDFDDYINNIKEIEDQRVLDRLGHGINGKNTA